MSTNFYPSVQKSSTLEYYDTLYHFIMSPDNQSNAAQLNVIITFIYSTLTVQSPGIAFSLLGIWQNDL